MRAFPILFVVLACAADAAAHPPQEDFYCARGATTNGWCRACRVGYLATVEIRSARLFETIDPHGHDSYPDKMACAGCREAWATNGYCYDCRIGYVGGHGYFTRLTYDLARGDVVDPATLTCPVCVRAAAEKTLPLSGDGWCDACGRGMVGNVQFRDRKVYADARKQFELLLRAVKESERCEMCSMLLFFGGVCRECNITYRNGKVVEEQGTKGQRD